MATASQMLDKLECGICYENYKVPKTLPCLHSFCSQCLSHYITSNGDHRTLRGFLCPYCWELACVTDNTVALTAETRNVYFIKIKRVMAMESRIQIGWLQAWVTEDLFYPRIFTCRIQIRSWYNNKVCFGIAALHNNCLALSYTNCPGIDIVTFTGHRLRSLPLPENHLSSRLAAEGECLLVTCSTMATLVMLDEDGDVVHQHTRNPYLNGPAGAVYDGRMGIYADPHNNTVNEVAEDKVNVLLTEKDGLRRPTGVHLDGDKKLYVADGSTVKVFHYLSLSAASTRS